jgi:hypothetical protein
MLHRSSLESMRDVAAAASRERIEIPEKCTVLYYTVNSRTIATRLFPLLHLHDTGDPAREQLKGPRSKNQVEAGRPRCDRDLREEERQNPDHISKHRKKSDPHQTTTTTALPPSTTPLHPHCTSTSPSLLVVLVIPGSFALRRPLLIPGRPTVARLPLANSRSRFEPLHKPRRPSGSSAHDTITPAALYNTH